MSNMKQIFDDHVRYSSHWGWKSAKWAQGCVDLWNNLGFSLCAAPSVYHMVATLDKRKKSEMEVSADWCVTVEH